mgnify:CR=1
MENASKALIIAGAILISILLISVGILVMNSTGNMQDQVSSSADSMAIETFNSQFLSYETDTNSAAQIRTLISKVNASNASNDATTSADEKYVEVAWGTGLSASTLKSTKRYTVTVGYATTGYINKLTISETP